MTRKCAGSATFNLPSTLAAVEKLRRFNRVLKTQLKDYGPDAEIEVDNSDLICFFLSVPQDRLIDDVRWLLTFFDSVHRRGQEKQARTRCASLKGMLDGHDVRALPGWLPGYGGKAFPEKYVLPVVRHAMIACIFQIGSVVIRQQCAAFIGSPMLPPLCILSVMRSEYVFMQSQKAPILSWTPCRYVDNRLTVWIKSGQFSDLPEQMRHPDSYGSPVVLEPEPDLSYVGCIVHNMRTRLELEFKVPGFQELATTLGMGDPDSAETFDNQRWRYRNGCGDVRAVRSGTESRLCGAVRSSFPVVRAQAAVLKVFSIGVYLQHPSCELIRLLDKHARKFPIVDNGIFSSLRRCIVRGGPLGAIDLVEMVLAIEERK